MDTQPIEPAVELTHPIQNRVESAAPVLSAQQRAHHGAEKHSGGGNTVRDFILGYADGLTVPFAVTASMTNVGSAKTVVLAGLAELFGGAISMGLSAYQAATSERDRYDAEEMRERQEVATDPEAEKKEIHEILGKYGISRDASTMVVEDLQKNEENWILFMMHYELQLFKPRLFEAYISAGVMALAYFIGGLIPMIPYFAMSNLNHALFVSIGITVTIFTIFGFIKSYYNVPTLRSGLWGSARTIFVGSLAAGTSYGIVRGLHNSGLFSDTPKTT